MTTEEEEFASRGENNMRQERWKGKESIKYLRFPSRYFVIVVTERRLGEEPTKDKLFTLLTSIKL